MQVRPRRSVLYMPGINQRALDKARTIAADSLILDLGSSDPEAKEAARRQVCAVVKAGGYGERELVIRVNALETPWGADDLRPPLPPGPMRCSSARSAGADDMVSARMVLGAAGAPDTLQIGDVDPASIVSAREIASLAGERQVNFTCLVIGTDTTC